MMSPWLRIEAPHFVAGLAFARDDSGGWWVVDAAPIVKWMKGMPAAEVKVYLDRKGWRWEWLK